MAKTIKTRETEAPRTRSRKVDLHDMSAADVARVFGISAQAVGRWECPRTEDRRYDLPAVVAWREAKAADAATTVRADGEGSPALEAYRWHRAALAEMEVNRQKGVLVRRAEVEQKWRRVLGLLVQVLEGVGQRVAPRCEGRTVVDISREVGDEVRQAIEDARVAYEQDGTLDE